MILHLYSFSFLSWDIKEAAECIFPIPDRPQYFGVFLPSQLLLGQDESQGLVSKTWAIWKEMGSFWGSQFVGKRELLSVSSTTAQGLLGQVPEEERCGRVQQARMEGHTQVLQMLTLFCAFSSRRRRRNKKEDFMAWNHTHRAPAEGCACCWGKPGKTGIIRWGNWPGSGLDVVVHVWFSCKTRQKCWW